MSLIGRGVALKQMVTGQQWRDHKIEGRCQLSWENRYITTLQMRFQWSPLCVLRLLQLHGSKNEHFKGLHSENLCTLQAWFGFASNVLAFCVVFSCLSFKQLSIFMHWLLSHLPTYCFLSVGARNAKQYMQFCVVFMSCRIWFKDLLKCIMCVQRLLYASCILALAKIAFKHKKL